MSVDWLRELDRLALDSDWVLLKGVEGTYNRHDYFAEREVALEGWGQLLVQLEQGDSAKVIPIAASRRVAA